MSAAIEAQAGARVGAWIAVAGILLDQASKHWVLDIARLSDSGPWPLSSFADLRLVWNRGISYGLFQQGSEAGRWMLVGVAIVAAIGLELWLVRIRSLLVGLAVGLILAGAVGNAIDRAIYGAVIDFVYLHSPDGTLTWYVFNLADAWIVVGVAALLYDSILSNRSG